MPKHSPLVAICGHRKSGTTLLSNLLDGHPRLAVYPIDLALLYAYFPDFVETNPSPQARRKRLERILFDDLADRLGAFGCSDAFDVDKHRERFFRGLRDDELADLRALIVRLMASFQTVAGPPVGSAKWGVIKETSIEIYAAEILSWFPDIRFIHVLRDPRDNFAALAAGVDKHYGRLGEDRKRTLASLLHRAELGFAMARENQTTYGSERYHLVRYEDFVVRPEATMCKIAAVLDIDFDPCLLRPTVLGVPATGNSYDGVQTAGIESRNVGRWRERITDEEAAAIEFHFSGKMEAFGYAPAFDAATRRRAAAEFYKWQNYAYFYSDRFAPAVVS
ncbi:MAG: sulfotransferase [Pseudolabrys sp.]